MTKYNVLIIDAGCSCCSFLTVAVFDTLEKAQEFVGDSKNYVIEEEDWEDEDGEGV